MNEVVCEASGKICYSKKRAGDIVNTAKSHVVRGGKSCRRSSAKKIPLRVYFCTACGAYHTTSEKTRGAEHGRTFKNKMRIQKQLEEK